MIEKVIFWKCGCFKERKLEHDVISSPITPKAYFLPGPCVPCYRKTSAAERASPQYQRLKRLTREFIAEGIQKKAAELVVARAREETVSRELTKAAKLEHQRCEGCGSRLQYYEKTHRFLVCASQCDALWKKVIAWKAAAKPERKGDHHRVHKRKHRAVVVGKEKSGSRAGAGAWAAQPEEPRKQESWEDVASKYLGRRRSSLANASAAAASENVGGLGDEGGFPVSSGPRVEDSARVKVEDDGDTKRSWRKTVLG